MYKVILIINLISYSKCIPIMTEQNSINEIHEKIINTDDVDKINQLIE